ncbi:hypothetical protein BKA93DRAFT_748972 [Sparassis latifolia]
MARTWFLNRVFFSQAFRIDSKSWNFPLISGRTPTVQKYHKLPLHSLHFPTPLGRPENLRRKCTQFVFVRRATRHSQRYTGQQPLSPAVLGMSLFRTSPGENKPPSPGTAEEKNAKTEAPSKKWWTASESSLEKMSNGRSSNLAHLYNDGTPLLDVVGDERHPMNDNGYTGPRDMRNCRSVQNHYLHVCIVSGAGLNAGEAQRCRYWDAPVFAAGALKPYPAPMSPHVQHRLLVCYSALQVYAESSSMDFAPSSGPETAQPLQPPVNCPIDQVRESEPSQNQRDHAQSVSSTNRPTWVFYGILMQELRQALGMPRTTAFGKFASPMALPCVTDVCELEAKEDVTDAHSIRHGGPSAGACGASELNLVTGHSNPVNCELRKKTCHRSQAVNLRSFHYSTVAKQQDPGNFPRGLFPESAEISLKNAMFSV